MTPEAEFAQLAATQGRAAIVTVVEGARPGVQAPRARGRDPLGRPGGAGAGGRRRRGGTRAHVGRALRGATRRRRPAVRGRHLPRPAAGRLRRRGLHHRAVQAGGGARVAAVRVRPALGVRHPRALPRGGDGGGRLAGGGLRGHRRDRPRDLRLRADPRPQAGRRRAGHRAALGRRLRGRHGQHPRPGDAPRAAAGAGLHRAGAGAPGRADRAGPGRHRARRRRPCRSWPRWWPCRNGRSGGRLRDKQGGRIHEITGQHA